MNDCITTLSEAYIVQPLSEHVVLLAGKIDGSTVIDKNEFAGNEKTQFMNTMLRLNPVLLPFAPYTSWAAGVTVKPTVWLSSLTAVADTNGSATVVGFDTAFHSPRGATFVEELTFNVKPLGLKGSHVVGIHYSTKEFTVLDLGRADIFLEPGRGLIIKPDTRPDDWALAYNSASTRSRSRTIPRRAWVSSGGMAGRPVRPTSSIDSTALVLGARGSSGPGTTTVSAWATTS